MSRRGRAPVRSTSAVAWVRPPAARACLHGHCAERRQPPPRPWSFARLLSQAGSISSRDRRTALPDFPGPRATATRLCVSAACRDSLGELGPGGVHRFEHRGGLGRQFRHAHGVALQLCRDILAVLALGRPLRLGDPAQAVAEPPRRDDRIGPDPIARMSRRTSRHARASGRAARVSCRSAPRLRSSPRRGPARSTWPGPCAGRDRRVRGDATARTWPAAPAHRRRRQRRCRRDRARARGCHARRG